MHRLNLAFLLIITALSATTQGQIFFTQGATIEEYSLSGSPINTAFLTFPAETQPQLAVDGSDLFVLHTGVVSEYTFDGHVVNPDVTTQDATAMAVSGDELFLSVLGGRTSPSTIMEFTTAGGLLNPSLGVANPVPEDMIVSGNNLFVESDPALLFPPGLPHTIGIFPISGGTPIPGFIGSPTFEAYDVAIIGDDLFTSSNQQIAEFSATSGQLVTAALIPNMLLGNPLAIISAGGNLYFATNSGISEYAPDGTPISVNLIPEGGFVDSLAVNVPEPGPLSLLALATGVLLFRRRKSYRLN